jgi:hypothetical protein
MNGHSFTAPSEFAANFVDAADVHVVLAAEAPRVPTTVDGLSFVEGLVNAEDLVHVPQTEWIIASGMAEGGGGRRAPGSHVLGEQSQ